MRELDSYGTHLLEKPMIAVITKMDLPENVEPAEELGLSIEQRGLPVHKISAQTGRGLKELLYHTARLLKRARERSFEAS